ncbi:MAG: S46 family peptidase, partial [Tannerella sp.]|nr:S46 family peptidase [Tannerella sp.]
MIQKKLVTFLLLLAGWIQAYADEGMWIINELNERSLARMKELGFGPDYQFIYNKDAPSLANAVVIFGGGCTGITVSEEGLLFTNHHCGYGSIQKLSSVEHNYLQDGFVSKNRTEELPVEGLSVYYLKETVDVTDRILPHIALIDDEYKRTRAADSIGKILSEVGDLNRFIKADVVPFYSRNKYYLVIYQIFRDVRLVFAPPATIGKFGGDTDNWMWPRHTCDFAVFRVYADADNRPAEYHEDNRPYRPAFVAEISLQGYQENDYAMTIGFPGSTDRYLTSWGVQQRIKSINEPRIEVRGIKQDIWRQAMLADEAIRLKYASKYAISSNYWKNSIGMNRGLAKLRVLQRKQAEEAAFEQWALSGENEKTYGKVINLLKEGYTSVDEERKYLTYLTEAFSNGAEIVQLANIFRQIDPENLLPDEMENLLNDRIRPFLKN